WTLPMDFVNIIVNRSQPIPPRNIVHTMALRASTGKSEAPSCVPAEDAPMVAALDSVAAEPMMPMRIRVIGEPISAIRETSTIMMPNDGPMELMKPARMAVVTSFCDMPASGADFLAIHKNMNAWNTTIPTMIAANIQNGVLFAICNMSP